jgi:predicted MFS family arabinose efflux permease
VLFQSGRLMSSVGSASSQIAYPLLVLALTGSPAKAGIVGFARLLPPALLSLPAGLAADQYDRRMLMIASDAVRAVAVGLVAAMVIAGHAAFWPIPIAAFVEGCGTAVFSAAMVGAVRSIVPQEQLPAAVASNTGRTAAVQIAGPPLGGALFEIARSLPFVVDAVSYVFSTASLVAMRTPFQEERQRDTTPIRARLAEGFTFLWNQPFLRTTSFAFGLLNFAGPGAIFAVVVIGREQGLTGGQVGLLSTLFGAFLLLGSFLSPLVRRRLPSHAILVLEMWTWCCIGAFLVWPSVYVLAVSLIPPALAIPSTDSVVHALGMAVTPDRLIGRVESVRLTIALAVAPLGPLLGGWLIDAVSARAAIAMFAGTAFLLALWGTLSPAIRAAPQLADLR